MNDSVAFSTFTALCNQRLYLVPKGFLHLQVKPHVRCPWQPLPASSLGWRILTFLVSGIPRYVAFCPWLLELGTTIVTSIHVEACVGTSFLFMAG